MCMQEGTLTCSMSMNQTELSKLSSRWLTLVELLDVDELGELLLYINQNGKEFLTKLVIKLCYSIFKK